MSLNTLHSIYQLPQSTEREKSLMLLSIELMANEIDDRHHKELMKKMIGLYAETNNALMHAMEDVKRLSITDHLTQVYNRVKFMEMLNYEIERFQRIPNHFGIVLLDIDHFKRVNDTYGHPAGDGVLQELCKIVSSRIRKIDTFARWGGEEFILLFPNITSEDLLNRTENLRLDVEHFTFSIVQHITCSFGATLFTAEDTENTVIQKADDALYTSKRTGRNKVTLGL